MQSNTKERQDERSRFINDQKQYLNRIEKLDFLIKSKQIEIIQLQDMATNITAPTDSERIQTSGVKDRIGSIVAKISDLESKKNRYIDQFMQIRSDAIHVMDGMDRVEYSKILFKKYIEYKPLYKIADDLNYSYRHVKRMFREALKSFGETRML